MEHRRQNVHSNEQIIASPVCSGKAMEHRSHCFLISSIGFLSRFSGWSVRKRDRERPCGSRLMRDRYRCTKPFPIFFWSHGELLKKGSTQGLFIAEACDARNCFHWNLAGFEVLPCGFHAE